MADVGEFRGLIVAVTFLSVFAVLIAQIPAEFSLSENSTRQITIPDYFEASEIQSFAETYNFTLTSSSSSTGPQELGGYYFNQLWVRLGTNYTYIYRLSKFWIFYINEEMGNFYHSGVDLGNTLYETRLDSDYTAGNITNLKYLTEFGSTTQMYMFFAFNVTTYNSPSEAWANDELEVLWAMSFDEVNTAYNAWDLIALMLFYDMPNIHSSINVFIKIVIWVTIAYITIEIMRKFLPFVGGS